MDKELLLEAEKLLQEPAELHDIPIWHANSALNITSLTANEARHEFYHVEYLIYPSNLYLVFESRATKDTNGNFDTPILQKSRDGITKPLWQEFRERFQKKIGTSVSHVFFGDYDIGTNGDEFFTVKSEPKDCRWRYTRKRNKDSIFITAISKSEALQYQAILDEIRLERAIKIVEDRHARIESRAGREYAITSLDSKYASELDLFTFGDETFRFRQFSTEFFYTPAGLLAFDTFYQEIAVPYRDDEITTAEWKEKSYNLEKRLTEDEDLGPELRINNVSKFNLSRLKNGNCEVESDLLDDRTGRLFRLVVKSQDFDDILDAVASELTVVFQRKKQIRRANEALHLLASKK